MSTMPGLSASNDFGAEPRGGDAHEAPRRKTWKLLVGVLLVLFSAGSVAGIVIQYVGGSSVGPAAGDQFLGSWLIELLLGGLLFVLVPAVLAAWLLRSWRRRL